MPNTTTRENLSQRNSKMLPIDGKKFEKLLTPMLKERGLSFSALSLNYGYNKNYLKKLIYSEVISIQATRMIENDFGIKYDAYKYVEPEKAEPKPEPKSNDFNENLIEAVTKIVKALSGIECELVLLNKKLDDLRAQSELNEEILEEIKGNTARIKPYVSSKESQ